MLLSCSFLLQISKLEIVKYAIILDGKLTRGSNWNTTKNVTRSSLDSSPTETFDNTIFVLTACLLLLTMASRQPGLY